MRQLLKNRDLVVLAALLMAGTVGYFTLESNSGHVGGVAELDGYYYYIYLRSLQVDGDLDFANEYEQWGNPFEFGETPTGAARNVFGVGPAILWAPFFLLTHLVVWIATLLGEPLSLDGMSRAHQVGTFYGSLVFAWLAIVLCYLVARRAVGREVALWAALGAGLAGPLPGYSFTWASFSHAHAAAAASLMVLLWLRWRGAWTPRRWILFGASAGLLLLVRPACVALLAVPAAAGVAHLLPPLRGRRWGELLRSAVRGPLPGALAALVVFLPQMLVWKALFGSFIVTPQGTGFMWWEQNAWAQTLFAPRNGLFVSAPVMLVAMIGLLGRARRDPGLGLPLWLGFALLVLVNGAVYDWWGWGFSARRYTAALPIFVIGLAAALHHVRRWFAANPARSAGYLCGAVLLAAIAFNLAWARLFVASNLTWSNVRSTQGLYMTVAHGVIDRLYRSVGNPLSLPGSLGFTLRRGGDPRTYDRIAGRVVLGEAHPGANPSADPMHNANVDLTELEHRPLLSEQFGTPKRIGKTRYVPLRAPRGHVFLPVNRPGSLDVLLGAGALYPGTRLEVRFNGTTITERALPSRRWSRVVFTVPARVVARGINRLDLIHHLPRGWNAPGRRCLPAGRPCLPVDLAAVSGGRNHGNFAEIWVAGRKVSDNVVGFNVAVIDPGSGELLGARAFNTAAYPAEFAGALAYLRSFPAGSVVALATRGDMNRHWDHGGARLLAAVGARTDLGDEEADEDAGFVAIGVLGGAPGSAIERTTSTGHARARLGFPPPPWREIARYRVIRVR